MRSVAIVSRRAAAMILLALAAAVLSGLAGPARADPVYPALRERVEDGASLLDATTREALVRKLDDFERASGAQIVVATVPSLQDYDIETFANGLFRAWRLGDAKDNNGLLLLVAPKERKVRIEVGYGLEGAMTDALSKYIIANVIAPNFRQNDYSAGIVKGVDAIVAALGVDKSEWRPKADRRPAGGDAIDPELLFFLFILAVFVILALRSGARGSSGRWARQGGRTIFIPGPPSGWGGGFGGGGGGFDGGGFSGGGGSSGGGGASGDW